jgi:hypothetical protein
MRSWYRLSAPVTETEQGARLWCSVDRSEVKRPRLWRIEVLPPPPGHITTALICAAGSYNSNAQRICSEGRIRRIGRRIGPPVPGINSRGTAIGCAFQLQLLGLAAIWAGFVKAVFTPPPLRFSPSAQRTGPPMKKRPNPPPVPVPSMLAHW